MYQNKCGFIGSQKLKKLISSSTETRIGQYHDFWVFASPGHQQPSYWDCTFRITVLLSIMRKSINWLCHFSVEKSQKMKMCFYDFSNIFSESRVNSLWPSDAILQHKSGFNFGSCNDLLPHGTKSLPEPMLTCHQRYCVAFTWEQFHKYTSTILYIELEYYTSKIHPASGHQHPQCWLKK